MGRPRTATSILEARGAFDKNPDRRRTGEPKPPDGELVKPKWLKGRGAAIWKEILPICFGMKTAARGDEFSLAQMCQEQAAYEKDPDRYQTSRLNALRALCERFGVCGGGSRAKLSVGDGSEDKKKDPAIKYFDAVVPDSAVRQ